MQPSTKDGKARNIARQQTSNEHEENVGVEVLGVIKTSGRKGWESLHILQAYTVVQLGGKQEVLQVLQCTV